MVAEQVSTQWVMEAHRARVAEGVHQEDIIQPADGVEARSEASVVPPLTKPNIALSESEQPLYSSVAPSADAAGQPR